MRTKIYPGIYSGTYSRHCLGAIRWGLLTLLCTALLACHSSVPAQLNLTLLKQEIQRLTNDLRGQQNLPALLELTPLDEVSKRHSLDMASRDFFDHINPDGKEPFERLQAQAPQLLCASSGENIAMQSLDGMNAQEMAQKLVDLWRESPEHYAHMIEPNFWHLGIGLSQTEDRIYATQTFAAAVVEMESELPSDLQEGQYLNLRFRFLAPFPADELSVFWHTPDASARIPAGDGRFYIGKGPLKAQWSDDEHFSVELPLRYGRGQYRLLFGHKNSYYDAPYTFAVE